MTILEHGSLLARTRLCRKCCGLSEWCRNAEVSPGELERKWRKLFPQICKRLGIGRELAETMFDDPACEDWASFYMTNDEGEYCCERWLETFADDLFYCSDRWTLDRLARVHWEYGQCMRTEGRSDD